MNSGGGGGAADEHSRPATAEEEALKRNTDCVYFLASPLTCKNGSECEYRHSEVARVNPRDCWYWLNGECLNPKCAFRHPPLDPLFGFPGSKSGPAQPPYAPFQMPYCPSAYNTKKQNVPCYYFQKGQCLKGDKCLFMHGQSTSGNTNPQHVTTSPLCDPPSTNNKEKLITKERPQQTLPKESVNQREMSSLSFKPVVIESASNNGSIVGQRASPCPSKYEHPPFESSYVPHSWSENVLSPSVDERLQTGREVDEFLGESSPGFDVLVDDHVEDQDYLQNEEEYGQEPVQGGENVNLFYDFDYRHSDYEHVSRYEKDRFVEGNEHDRYGRSCDHPYGQEHLRVPSERRRERSRPPEKRKFNTDRVHESDLRQHLKQRRLHGGRSAVSPDQHPSHSRISHDLHERRTQGWHSSREYRSIQKEGFVGSHLQGRISLPVRSEIEINGERNHNRSSTGRPTNYTGRLHERINRQNEDSNYGARKYNGQISRRAEADTMDFAGPKSLAELKCAKVSEVSQDRKGLGSKDYQGSEETLSFEGPKPLSVILKKKDTASGNVSCNSDWSKHRDLENHIDLPISEAGCDDNLQRAFEATKGGNTIVAHRVTEVDEEEEGTIPEENEELLNEEFSERGDINEEDGVMMDRFDYHETDNYDQQDGEFDYEGSEGGEFKLEDDEVFEEDEDDDGDFAKRAGFMLS